MAGLPLQGTFPFYRKAPVNNQLFEKAHADYEAKDYQGALVGYTQCLQDPMAPPAPGEMGRIYHQIGNCLVKLKNPTEAIQAYTQAQADAAYADLATVECNLGLAYASLRDYDNAINCFELALADPNYATPHKAHMGMGNALMKLGKTAEAGVAFREAALDATNPEPAKSLLNLGVCFMALNRPADAVASYESAMQFDMDSGTSNKLNASLGQAYVACNQMEKAVEAFDRALADKTYALSDSANVDYQRAVGVIAQAVSESTADADTSGVDVSSDMVLYDSPTAAQDPFYYDEGQESEVPAYGDMYEGDDDKFFSASEEEIEQWSKGFAKQDRKRRNVGLKVLVVVVVLVVLAFGGAVFGYLQGYGIPTQEMVTQQLFGNPSDSQGVFANSVSESSAASMADCVVADDAVRIDAVQRSLGESTVYATATTSEGGEITYRIAMVRDMLGWKVSNVELYFPSQNA